MSEPRRLLQGEFAASKEEVLARDLLRSATGDRGSDAVLRRTLDAIGAGAGGAALLTGAGVPLTSPLVAKAGTGLKGIALKLAIGGALATAIAVGISISRWESSPADPSGHDRSSRRLASQPSEPKVAIEIVSPPAVPRRAIPRPTDPEAPSRVSQRGEASTHAESAAGMSLSREVAALDAARAALASKGASDALRALEAYRHEFPTGALRPEEEVLRVQALLESGDRPAAEALAARVLANKPTGSHAARLRSLMGWGTVPFGPVHNP